MKEDQIVKPISIDVAKKIVQKHFNHLINKTIKYKGGGSFSVFTVGNEIVLRLSKDWAKNKDILHSYRNEKAILDEIRNSLLPHIIPQHITAFEDLELFEGVIWVTKQFTGQPLNQIKINENSLKVISMIADFLTKLHSINPNKIPSEATKLSTESDIKKSWFQNYEYNKNQHFKKLSKDEQVFMHKVYENFLSKATEMKPMQVITHGDFDHSNCMWDSKNNYLHIIDCEDIGLGHAVGDFCTWYGNYGETFLKSLIECYGLEVDKYFAERAKFYWLRIPFAYFEYAKQYNNTKFEDFARQLLTQNMQRFPQ